MADDKILAKVLPIKITPKSRSGLSSNAATSADFLSPFRARWRKRYRLSDIMPVSDPEKNADKIINTMSAINNNNIVAVGVVYNIKVQCSVFFMCWLLDVDSIAIA